ncbi:MAG TPA: hypothetical protein PKG54_04880 [Phycisphaerae bacterium]|jgi:hypothetical protein|nr:hypothetical protein [Phycisphaerae bacterium]HOB73841.1 hypothetical protein [Phycisphaerae bacterium]HOJ53944.1 hypothetical protein [Phycisphaerae bacterium]HOL27551.1 hypothetical protein [Phycisphaerae bacterium]HPP22566.1 hypothetical protein [Phycisphaerae bacterium]
MTQRNRTPSPQSIKHGYEVRDTNPRWILIAGAGLTLLVVATIFLMRWTLGYLTSEQPADAGPPLVLRGSPPLARGPSISEDPQERKRMEAFRAKENERLNSYGRDPLTQTIHIPIERAMQLVLVQGFPVRPADQQPPVTGPANEASPAQAGVGVRP